MDHMNRYLLMYRQAKSVSEVATLTEL